MPRPSPFLEDLASLKKIGFFPASAISTRKFASAIKRLTTDVCACVLVHDGRADSDIVEVVIWVAPIDCPDDGFDPLGVGYRILLGTNRDPDEEFFARILLRIELLSHRLDGLVDSVLEEMDRPELQTYRLQVYRLERELYRIICTRATEERDVECMNLLGLALQVAKGRLDYEDLSKRAREVTKELVGSGALSSALKNSILAGKLHLLDPSRQLYAEALAPTA